MVAVASVPPGDPASPRSWCLSRLGVLDAAGLDAVPLDAVPLDEAGLDAVPLDELERALVTGWAEQTAHLARWLAVLAVFDRREGWSGAGIVSCAHWLSINCGISPKTAAEHVRVAARLRSLPRVARSFATGELSYSKVRAICRVATPDTEEDFAELAKGTNAGQLERVLRVVERQRNGTALSEDEKEMRRSVTTWTDDDGLARIEIVCHPDEAQIIMRGIDFGRDQLYREAKAELKAAAAAASRATPPINHRRRI